MASRGEDLLHFATLFGRAPVVILAMHKRSPAVGKALLDAVAGGSVSSEAISTAMAVQNLLLTARALGLSGSIFNLPLSHVDELMKLLDIPENNQVFCLLPIGYPTDRHGPVRRKPVKSVVFRERFGQTWEFARQQPEEGWQAKWIGEGRGANG